MRFVEKSLFEKEKLQFLYQSVGWTWYQNHPELYKTLLLKSLWWCGILNEDEDLVGLIRVVGDGYSIVYLQDLLIHPDYQGQGLGKALVKKLLDKFSSCYQIVLLTDSKDIGFYQGLGFTGDGLCGLLKRTAE